MESRQILVFGNREYKNKIKNIIAAIDIPKKQESKNMDNEIVQTIYLDANKAAKKLNERFVLCK